MTAATCPTCSGSGERITSPCNTCRGRGHVPVTDTLTVQIPAGVDDGAQLRVSGRGESGLRGGRSGDLYVSIRVAEHALFKRAGPDLGCEVPVPMTVAALGGEVQVPTLIDGPSSIDVKPGTQSGEIVRLRGKGMPRLDGRGRGEQVVLLKVETPHDLTEEQVDLLQQLARLRDEPTASKQRFFDRIKEAFQ
jgi:molecular chaperone DnaJ